MSDSNSTTPDIALDLKNNTSVLPTPGEVLRLNRENSGLSLADVAAALNVTVSKVQYLEADEFQKMHSEPFIRGYLRSYAKLLKIDAEGLIRCYDEFTSSNDTHDINGDLSSVGGVENNKSSFSAGKIIPLAFLLMASAWFVAEGLNRTDIATDVSVPAADIEFVVESEPSEQVDDTDSENKLESNQSVDVLTEGAAGSVNNVLLVTENAVVESKKLIEPSLDKLDFTFTDESWVEVTDSGNDVLFADVKQAGETLHLEGVAPFNVMLGNARATSVTLNGKSVPSVPENGRKTLKFTVSSD